MLSQKVADRQRPMCSVQRMVNVVMSSCAWLTLVLTIHALSKGRRSSKVNTQDSEGSDILMGPLAQSSSHRSMSRQSSSCNDKDTAGIYD